MNLLLLVCSAILLVAPSQALSCVEAEAEFTDPSATACNDILTSGDIFHMSDENIQKFCTDHNCPAVLTRVYGDIAKACGNGIVSHQLFLPELLYTPRKGSHFFIFWLTK